jgi:hypothetical protein
MTYHRVGLKTMSRKFSDLAQKSIKSANEYRNLSKTNTALTSAVIVFAAIADEKQQDVDDAAIIMRAKFTPYEGGTATDSPFYLVNRIDMVLGMAKNVWNPTRPVEMLLKDNIISLLSAASATLVKETVIQVTEIHVPMKPEPVVFPAPAKVDCNYASDCKCYDITDYWSYCNAKGVTKYVCEPCKDAWHSTQINLVHIQGGVEKQDEEAKEEPTHPAQTAPKEKEEPTHPAQTAPKEKEEPTPPVQTAPKEKEEPTSPVQTAPKEKEEPTSLVQTADNTQCDNVPVKVYGSHEKFYSHEHGRFVYREIMTGRVQFFLPPDLYRAHVTTIMRFLQSSGHNDLPLPTSSASMINRYLKKKVLDLSKGDVQRYKEYQMLYANLKDALMSQLANEEYHENLGSAPPPPPPATQQAQPRPYKAEQLNEVRCMSAGNEAMTTCTKVAEEDVYFRKMRSGGRSRSCCSLCAEWYRNNGSLA